MLSSVAGSVDLDWFIVDGEKAVDAVAQLA